MDIRGAIATSAIRLAPGTDLRRELQAIAQQKRIGAAILLGAVGSLSQVCLRFADAAVHTKLPGKHEILTLSGTVAEAGIHVHMTVADAQGNCKGGHLVEGCEVYTTVELVLALLPAVRFQREFDASTGFKELLIAPDSEFL
ncbi:DNA-binding protein [filamentous cyanobacterium LEGE 11480]|uniref:DNA-binding protein n=1 Tax=Romeriopsis navalis LEGE 11480 TaxID=2777977 RepID=A0A928Z603_9CYAN|nr:PPC domain-containing DNA-binding protein [Romeriopsis navalis]MBE9032537.1 DNA-binding protein [Romeriopsis navalis LEGE 11480]